MFFSQTREADLLRTNWYSQLLAAGSIPYAQGSDHDVFLDSAFPATMLATITELDPSHSEDKIDKTDAKPSFAASAHSPRQSSLVHGNGGWPPCPGEAGPCRRLLRIGVAELAHRLVQDSTARCRRQARSEEPRRV